jgi:hypothetical protein
MISSHGVECVLSHRPAMLRSVSGMALSYWAESHCSGVLRVVNRAGVAL